MQKIWYTIEKNGNGSFTLWENNIITNEGHGSCGCRNIFNGSRKECVEYCKKNNIKISKGDKRI